MPRPIPPAESLTLTTLRRARGLTGSELADLSGLSKGLISRYEMGTDRLTREKLDELASVMDYDTADVDSVLHGILGATTRPQPSSLTPVDPTPSDRRRIREALGRLTRAELEGMEQRFLQQLREARAQRDRNAAEDLVRWLLEEPDPRVRRELVETSRLYQQWAVAERLSHESERATAGSAAKALELAHLALLVAELAPGDPVWSQRLQGYAWLFVANARRVGGDLPAAGQGFERATQLWGAGLADSGLLAAWRFPDGKASWCRQGEPSRALELHEEALVLAPPEAKGRILLNKAVTLEKMGEPGKALATLKEAERWIDRAREPQCDFAIHFNLAVNLCHLRRFTEAEALLETIGEKALALGQALNGIRVLWLRGRIDAGLGRDSRAEAVFEEVRQAFYGQRIAYDFAQLTLELAVLYRSQGRLEEVKALAKETLWIFDAQGVHVEAEKALRLFCEAAEAERLTEELARHILRYFERAQHNPGLRYEE